MDSPYGFGIICPCIFVWSNKGRLSPPYLLKFVAMKQVILFLTIPWLALSSLAAQNDPDAPPDLSDLPTFDSIYPQRVVYEMFDIEQPPKFPGGEKELLKYLAEHIKYPAVAADSSFPGPFAVSFIVELDGSITSIKVIRNDGPFAQSALKVISQMPHWSPGLKNGRPVAVKFTLPVRLSWSKN